MNKQLVKSVLALIGSVVCKRELSDAIKEGITPELIAKMFVPSQEHDMAHIVAQGLTDLGLLGEDEISLKFQDQHMLAVYRYQRMSYRFEQICGILEAEGIPFIPLKGAVLRSFYPEDWMRTSCDVDVLVHVEDFERALSVFVTNGYAEGGTDSHHATLSFEDGVCLELHYETVEEGRAVNAKAILSEIWDHATPKEGCQFHMLLDDEMFYFYHIAHIAKHFENGGCGIRSFLDLWILEHNVAHDDAARDALLQKGGLLTFANACRKLSAVWFEDAEPDDMTPKIEAYVLHGGIYGDYANTLAIKQNKIGGRKRYLLSRIFLPYPSLARIYPILKKHKWLTPVMEVRRWLRLLFRGKAKRLMEEIAITHEITDERAEEITSLLKQLGL